MQHPVFCAAEEGLSSRVNDGRSKSMSRFSNIFSGFAEGFKAARFHHALSRMSDRQLADIGLTRESIPRRALELAQLR
jgi:uncharacterized protein YjiS (DUF1127 family)